MRVLHLTNTDAGGGAARASHRVHTGLRRLGVDSHMVVLHWRTGEPTSYKLTYHDDLATRWFRTRRRRAIQRDWAVYKGKLPAGFEWFSDDRTEVGRDVAKTVHERGPWDVINLHWVGDLVDHEALFSSLPAGVPLVWRLADMAPLTGGCHYDNGCGKFHNMCGACPVLGSSVEDDLSRQIWQRKHAALAHVASDRMTLVGTSRWIAAQSRRSSLLSRFPVHVIPNGLDTAAFAPRDPAFARDTLGVPADAAVVLFVADTMDIKRKGWAQLLAALAQLIDVPNLFLLSVGGREPAGLAIGLPRLHLGKIGMDRVLSLAYSAADVFVIPSLQESFGQTVIESMACGTPVVGFDTGGIADTVRPGVTGHLAAVGDVDALANAIRKVLLDPDRRQMGQRGRQVVMDEYDMPLLATRYRDLYQRLIAKTA